jgi:hypothetical protein
MTSLKNRYPKWLPYPTSWLRSIVTVLILGPIGVLLSFLGFWFGSFTLLFSNSGTLAPISIAIFLTIGIGFTMIPIALMTCAHHVVMLIFYPQSISPDRPWWQPGWISWREGITGVVVISVSFAIAFLLLLLYRSDLLTTYNTLTASERDILFKVGTALWIAAAAYLYHWDYLVRDKRQKERQAKLSQNAPFRRDSDADNS